MDDLFRSDLDASSTGLNSGGDIGSSSNEPGGGDWTNPKQSGQDGDLQRSQEAVALNELLQEQGLNEGAVDALVQGGSYAELGGASEDPLLSEVAPPPLALSLVVLDQSQDNWRELAVSAPADAELLVLDQASDGVAQISDYLLQQRIDGQGSYSSLAIVSAGADGLLQLGNGTLEAASLSSYGDQLRTWADSLTSGADLLLFGSNVAASAAGVSFVQELASLTGTDVAASRDSTGATEQGGNVVLEEQTGSIETSLGWLEQSIDELPSHFLVVGEEQLGDGTDVLATWQQAQAEAGLLLRELPQRQDFAALIGEVFGTTGTDTSLFDQRVAALQSQLAGEGLGLTVELRSNGELNGAAGAYAAVGHTGSELVYLNADWIANGASAFLIRQVLLEETGHAIDQRLNGSLDSEGDEGALFAKRLTGEQLTDVERAAISADNDSALLTIDGMQVLVEKAATSQLLTNTPYTLSSNGSNPYVINVDLGQNWTFEADYRMDGSNGLNTVFSYGRYTDGVLVRTIRGDGLYLKGVNSGTPNIFNGTTTNEAYVRVRVTYVGGDNGGGKLEVYAYNGTAWVSKGSAQSTSGTLNPADKTIRIGSAHHANGEGFAGSVRNINIIVGSNSAPTVASADTQTTGENAVLNSSVPVATDVDGSIVSYTLATGIGENSGSLIFSTDGSYSFDPDGAFDQLAAGSSQEVTFTYYATDNSGADSDTQIVTINVTGSNDAPVITNAATALAGTVTEAGNLDDGTVVAGTNSVSGTLSAIDVDAGASQIWTIEGSPSTTYGSIAIDSSTGVWTYTLDNTLAATQALKEGQSFTQSYTARVTDDFGAFVDQTLTVTINGTNDSPVVTNVATVLNGSFEAGNLDNWTISVANGGSAYAVQSYAEQGEQGSTGFTYTPKDGSYFALLQGGVGNVYTSISQTINVSSGQVVSGWAFYDSIDYLPFLDDGAVEISMSGQSSSQPLFVANTSSVGNHGSTPWTPWQFTIPEDGAYIIKAKVRNTQDSVASPLLGLDFVVSNAQTVSTGSVTEAGNLDDGTVVPGAASVSGTLSATDVDAGATQIWAIQPGGPTTYGTIAIDASTGVWTYTLDNSLAATQALNQGESVTQEYTASVTDDFGAYVDQTITVTINGVNDAPAGSVTISGTAAEDQTLTAANTLSDEDGLGTISYQWLANGTAIAGASGSTYTLTQAEVGKTITVSASYSDGQGNAESVSSAATSAVANDQDAPDEPVLTLLSTTTFTEDAAGNAVGSVVATFSTSDEDGNSVNVTLSDTNNYSLGTGDDAGKVLLTAAGLALVNAGSALPSFTLTPNDNTVDGTAVQVDPAVTDVNDAPTVAVPLVNQSATENLDFSFKVPDDTFADVDAGDTLTFSATLANGDSLPGWLSFNAANGTFSGTPTNSDIGIISVAVTATDGSGASVSDTFYIVTATAAVTDVDAPLVTSVTVVEVDVTDKFVVPEGSGYALGTVSQAESVVDPTTGAATSFVLTTVVNGVEVVVAVPVPTVEELNIPKSGNSEEESEASEVTLIGQPVQFSLTTIGDADADPSRLGTQVVVRINLSGQGLETFALESLNYVKFYSQAAIDAAETANGELRLRGLDGQLIEQPGWFLFMRKWNEIEGDRVYYGDGAQYVVGSDGSLTLEIHLTDNEFGDTDSAQGSYTDPGLMYSLVASDSPDNVTPPPDQPAPQSGVFELASVGSTDSTFASVATPEETVTVETTADSGATTGSDAGSGSTKPDSSLVLAYAKRAFDDLITWATSSGLISLPADGQGAATSNGNGTRSTTTDESRTLEFVSQALGIEPGLASGMLQALALGGASLYAINRFSGGRVSSWVRKLLPAAPQVAAATAERIVVVFKLLSPAGLQCLVAARVDADKLEILAEQALPMSLSAAAAPSQADLEPHLRKLVERVSNQTGTHDLLLYDPHLRQELPIYDSLGRMQAELQPQSLDGILASLGPDQLVELRSWITRPSGTDLRQHPVGNLLQRRQRELRQRMDTDKASLISLLELSLALGQRFA